MRTGKRLVGGRGDKEMSVRHLWRGPVHTGSNLWLEKEKGMGRSWGAGGDWGVLPVGSRLVWTQARWYERKGIREGEEERPDRQTDPGPELT